MKTAANCGELSRMKAEKKKRAKVEKKDGQLLNVEFDAIKAMKDPGKSSQPK